MRYSPNTEVLRVIRIIKKKVDKSYTNSWNECAYLKYRNLYVNKVYNYPFYKYHLLYGDKIMWLLLRARWVLSQSTQLFECHQLFVAYSSIIINYCIYWNYGRKRDYGNTVSVPYFFHSRLRYNKFNFNFSTVILRYVLYILLL